jgi:hypothetical protein
MNRWGIAGLAIILVPLLSLAAFTLHQQWHFLTHTSATVWLQAGGIAGAVVLVFVAWMRLAVWCLNRADQRSREQWKRRAGE